MPRFRCYFKTDIHGDAKRFLIYLPFRTRTHTQKEATNKLFEDSTAGIQIYIWKSIIYVLHKCMYIYFGSLLITLSSEMTFCDGCIMLGNRNDIYGK